MSALLEVDALQLGPIGTNCYVVRAVGNRSAIVIDPGGDPERVLDLVDRHDLLIEAILATHGHYDHLGAVAALAQHSGAPVWMSELEAPTLEDPERFHMPGTPAVEPWRVDHRLGGGERIEIADVTLDVLLVPGHSPAHLAFLVDGARDASGDGYDTPPVCFDGDVIFAGSIGRTDLPFADGPTMLRTLRSLTTRLHPDTILLSGHGPATTMRRELASNPFLQGL